MCDLDSTVIGMDQVAFKHGLFIDGAFLSEVCLIQKSSGVFMI